MVREFDRPFIATGLTLDHFRKIRMADVVFVFNKDGYVGSSTMLEIGYAAACDKPIYAVTNDNDDARRSILFEDITPTPAELLTKLY